MLDIVLGAIAALAAVCLAPAMGLFGSRKGSFDEQCRERGWSVEGKGQGFDRRISGETDGIRWEYVAIHYSVPAPQRGEVSYTRWATADASLPAGDMVMIVPVGKRADQVTPVFKSIDKMKGFADTLADTIVVKRMGGDAHAAAEFLNMRIVSTGPDAVRKAFAVVATSEGAASGLLGKAEPALMGWAADPIFKSKLEVDGIYVWSKGLVIPVEKFAGDMERLDALVGLGASMAAAIRRG